MKSAAHTEQTEMPFNGSVVRGLRKDLSGLTSDIYLLEDGSVLKKMKRVDASTKNIFSRELYWLDTLGHTGIVPKVLDVDRAACAMILENCGECISCANAPKDWRIQLENILSVLQEHDCRHNDLSEKEILVKEGKLYLIDFGVASVGDDMSCGGRFVPSNKNRVFSDKYVTNLVQLALESERFGNTEPHCFVLWDTSEYEVVERAIAERFTIVQAITYSPHTVTLLGADRLEFLSRFYHGRVSQHGSKATQPFTVFVVLDQKPTYEVRVNYFNQDENIVNTNVFDLLQKLRNGRTSFLHGSDSIQESYDNLKTLTFYETSVPILYWNMWRPQFDSLRSFFATLNDTQGLEYVVLRNFETLAQRDVPEPGQDIDILVNDYYLFKRVSGAIGYKHQGSSRYKNKGQAYEYGGYKVAGKVLIRGQEVSIDIRYIGDDYYCAQWEKDILSTRVKTNGDFYTPDILNHFYSLLYHALVHKRAFSERYRTILADQAKALGIMNQQTPLTDAYAWLLLDGYMQEKDYPYVRPKELSIPFTARTRAGIQIQTDMAEAAARLQKGNYLESRHLLHRVLQDQPSHIKARIMLLKTETYIFADTLSLNPRLLKLRLKDFARRIMKKLKMAR